MTRVIWRQKRTGKKHSCDICSINQCMFCILVCHSVTMGLVVAIRQPTSLFIVEVHTERVYAYFAVICHLHLFLPEWLGSFTCCSGNRYQSKIRTRHRWMIMEKKICLLLILGFKPTTFQSGVWLLYHWDILVTPSTPHPHPPNTHAHTLCALHIKQCSDIHWKCAFPSSSRSM